MTYEELVGKRVFMELKPYPGFSPARYSGTLLRVRRSSLVVDLDGDYRDGRGRVQGFWFDEIDTLTEA